MEGGALEGLGRPGLSIEMGFVGDDGLPDSSLGFWTEGYRSHQGHDSTLGGRGIPHYACYGSCMGKKHSIGWGGLEEIWRLGSALYPARGGSQKPDLCFCSGGIVCILDLGGKTGFQEEALT